MSPKRWQMCRGGFPPSSPVDLARLSFGLDAELPQPHIPWMDQILPPKLSDAEIEALRQIKTHPATSTIPFCIQSRLVDLGYIKEVLGGIVLTDEGLLRIQRTDDWQAPPINAPQ